jgi:hypothetical protein
MRLQFSKNSVKPEKLGLPKLFIRSEGRTIYKPRFKLGDSGLIVEFGHYWGFGAYYVSSLRTPSGHGLALYGADNTLDSVISSMQMDKFRLWMDENKAKIVSKLRKEVI